MSIAFKRVPVYITGMSWLIVTASILIAICLTESIHSISMFVYYIPASVLALWELNVQRNGHKTSMTNSFNDASEREQMATDLHANEMRHMMANVAHDLKTPLAAFLGGTELITQSVNDLKNDIQEQSDHRPGQLGIAQGLSLGQRVRLGLLSIEESLSDIKSVNAFMVMTINRCIDYTKSSQGMQLVPKMETVNLKETFALPLNCMKGVQTRVRVQMGTVSDDICSHIITDQQWLQENLLCLLSNAVKYSSRGLVNVNVKLEPKSTIDRKIDNADSKLSSPTSRRQSKQSSSQTSQPTPHTLNALSSLSGTASTLAITPGASFKNKVIPSFTDLGDKELDRPIEQPDVLKGAAAMGGTRSISYGEQDQAGGQNEVELRPEIHVPRESAEKVLVVEVEDTGIGLSAEAMRNLFNPFGRAQKLAGGTGLGLYSLAKRLDALGGSYGVEKRKDGEQGSLFWFTIPYKVDLIASAECNDPDKSDKLSHSPRGRIPGSAAEDEAMTATFASSEQEEQHSNCAFSLQSPVTSTPISRSSSKKMLTSAPTSSACTPRSPFLDRQSSVATSGLSVLLVDDSLSIQKMATKMLRRKGYAVDQAENGFDALEAISDRWTALQRTYDVVLMDLQMPVMDGLEAMRRLRFREEAEPDPTQRRHQFVVGCSANAEPDIVEAALLAGADCFMDKPFSMDRFSDMLAKNNLTPAASAAGTATTVVSDAGTSDVGDVVG